VLIQPVSRKEFDERTFPHEFSYIVYKKDGKYYAKNGSTGNVEIVDVDASRVIQYAIDMSKNGGVVVLKPGTYYINPQFTYHLYGNPWAVGLSTDGADNLIIDGNGARLVANSGTEIILYVLNTSNSVIRNLILDGNKNNQTWNYTDGKALLLTGGVRSNNVYENITVMNARGDGIYIGNHKPDEYGDGDQPEYNAIIRNIRSQNNADVGQAGVVLDGCINCIAENIISYNDRVGLHISSPPNWPYPMVISNVQILDALHVGITDFYGNADLYDVAMYGSASNYFDEAFIKFTYPDARIKIDGLYIDASNAAIGNSVYSHEYIAVWARVQSSGNPLTLIIKDAYIKVPARDVYVGIYIEDNVNALIDSIKLVGQHGITVGGDKYKSSAVISNAEVSKININAFLAYHSTVYIYNVLSTKFRVYARGDSLLVLDRPYPQILYDEDVAGLRFQRNSGVATISANSTSITVYHRLVSVPSKVLITPLDSPPGKLWVQNITETSFNIVTDTAPTTNLKVAWYAEV
jgi:hypothetical protein